MKFRVVIEIDEDGVYVAQCPSLPGCISQGKTREESLENIKDAIKGYVESLRKHGEPVPPGIEEELVDVNV
ncbi:MAG: type II toxin-antitoxin system HicB family antitoxin [Candidatus Lokiarchaeia archaeon]